MKNKKIEMKNINLDKKIKKKKMFDLNEIYNYIFKNWFI